MPQGKTDQAKDIIRKLREVEVEVRRRRRHAPRRPGQKDGFAKPSAQLFARILPCAKILRQGHRGTSSAPASRHPAGKGVVVKVALPIRDPLRLPPIHAVRRHAARQDETA